MVLNYGNEERRIDTRLSVYRAPTLEYNRVGSDYIVLPTPTKSTANGACKNRYFGSPTYRCNNPGEYPIEHRTREGSITYLNDSIVVICTSIEGLDNYETKIINLKRQ